MNSMKMIKTVFGDMKRSVFAWAAAACLIGTAQGATQYASGTFTWNDASTAAWGSASGGPYGSVWTGGNDAVLEGASGTITISSPTAHNINFTTTGYVLSGASTLTLTGTTPTLTLGSGVSGTIGAVLAGTAGLVKNGTGSLSLTGTNTYTGATTIKAGTITVGDSSAGSLNGTTGTDLTFTGTGTFNVKEVASSTQGMGTLTFSAGEGNILSTAATSGSSATLTFASMATRAAGATANFNIAVNTSATANQIVLTSTVNAPLSISGSNNPGILFAGADFARYNTVGSYFRAVSYGTDANARSTIASGSAGIAAALGSLNTTDDVAITGAMTGQPTATLNTLRLGNALTMTPGSTLSVNGIILITGNTARIVGPNTSLLQPTTDGGELVLVMAPSSPGASGALQIASIIRDYSGGTSATKVTKAGIGMVTMQSTNTYTGVTTINAGFLRVNTFANINTASGLGKGSASGSAADLVINGGTLNYGNQAAAASTDRLFTIGPAGATLDVSGTSTTGNLNIGSAGGNIAFSDSNVPASLILANSMAFVGTGTLTAVLGDSATGANVTSLIKTGTGIWILAGANTYSGATTITNGTLRAISNAVPRSSAVAVTGGIYDMGGFANVTNGAVMMSGGAISNGTLVGASYTLSGGTVYANLAGTNTLTKLGAGTATLKGANTYSGETIVSDTGTLELYTNTALGTTSALRIASGATVYLASGVTATAGTLYLNGNLQKMGTWGAVGTLGVDYTNARFSGPGKLTVLAGLPSGTVLMLK